LIFSLDNLKVKNLILYIVLFPCTLNANAQSTEYLRVMKDNIYILDSVSNTNNIISIVKIFEEISNNEVKEWLPIYYAAYGLLKAAFEVQDKNQSDDLTNQAIEKIEKALMLEPSESELYALMGYAYISKMNAGSTLTGMKYLPKTKQVLNKAKQLNPANPRPYYLLANITYFTPKMYGGGKEKALPLLNEAIDKFNKFKPVNNIMPAWGKEDCLHLITDK
jgi:tetratricopeptide (TPR) repeat protein